MPPTVSAYDEIRNIYRLRGGPHIMSGTPSLLAGNSGGEAEAPDEAPKLIPAIIHQTYKSAKVPPAVRPFMQVSTPGSTGPCAGAVLAVFFVLLEMFAAHLEPPQLAGQGKAS